MPKLTDRFLAALKVEDGRKDRLLFDSTCRGLGVRVTAKGTRTFIAQWTDPVTRRKVREPIGVWGNITIDQAREAARILLGDVAKRINPRVERERERKEAERERAEMALTFEALVDEWAVLHLAQRRDRYRAEAVRAIKRAFPGLLKRPAVRITKTDAVNELDKLVMAEKAAMAGRTLAYARAAFRWAEKRGKVPANPFQGLPISAGASARERVLSDGELAEVWAAAGTLGYPWGPFFRLAMLTLQRREEVAGMRWSEISDDLSLWTLPGSRMKNGRPHDVHLSEAACAILREMRRIEGCDLVLSTTGKTPVSGFSKAKAALDAAIVKARSSGAAAKVRSKPEPLIEWRTHDLRRSGVSTLARLGFDSIVADKILAHQPAKLLGVAAIYQRHDFARARRSTRRMGGTCDRDRRAERRAAAQRVSVAFKSARLGLAAEEPAFRIRVAAPITNCGSAGRKRVG
jgi:integrase